MSYARAFLAVDLSVSADESGAKKVLAALKQPDNEMIAIPVMAPSNLPGGDELLATEAAKTPRVLLEGELFTAEDGYILTARGITACLPETYQNTIIAVGGLSKEGRTSASGKTVTRGLACYGDEAQNIEPHWFNLRLSTKGGFDDVINAAAGTRVLAIGGLAASVGEDGRVYSYINATKAILISSGGQPVAPEGTSRTSFGEKPF